MDEKVIYEVRVIKTPNGFRVEMNGDKEQMREYAFGRHMRHFARHAERKARFFSGHFGWGPWWWDDSEPEETDHESKTTGEADATSV